MSFGFGGPNLRSFDFGDAVSLARLVLDGVKFAHANWPTIRSFLKRNGHVIMAIMTTITSALLAGPFAYGSVAAVLGFIQVHVAILIISIIAAVGFSVFTALSINATRQEWQRRPNPAPITSD